jgi:hypothetical protein
MQCGAGGGGATCAERQAARGGGDRRFVHGRDVEGAGGGSRLRSQPSAVGVPLKR